MILHFLKISVGKTTQPDDVQRLFIFKFCDTLHKTIPWVAVAMPFFSLIRSGVDHVPIRYSPASTTMDFGLIKEPTRLGKLANCEAFGAMKNPLVSFVLRGNSMAVEEADSDPVGRGATVEENLAASDRGGRGLPSPRLNSKSSGIGGLRGGGTSRRR